MDNDPWCWNVADVQHFFLQDAIRFIADRPSGQLPDLNAFIQALGDEDVDGASLLDTIDAGTLRLEFGMSSMRQRGSIMHCIGKLKHLSREFRSRDMSPGAQTPLSLPAQQITPTAVAGLASMLPSTETVGESVRHGEVEVEDGQGRKRRKLNPTALGVTPKASREDLSSHLPDNALPVDRVFYGPTGFGNVIGELAPDGNILVDHHDSERAEDNYQFQRQHKRVGETQFVYSRMRHFLINAEEISVRRRGRDALAILPYREDMQQQARSATVIQANKDDTYVAIREQASLLQSGYDYSDFEQQSTGEWDWLLQHHKQKEGEKEVSIAGSDSDDDVEEALTTTGSDENKGPEAEEDEDEQVFDGARVAEVVDAEIERCITVWREKLPQLEEKRAWTVWRKTKQSRTMREVLIENANARIAEFTRRLNKLRDDVVDREYSSDVGVQRACPNLEPTIEDREMERWNISVWQRRKEPTHTVTHRTKQMATILQTPVTGKAQPAGSVLHPDDRMSVSPTPAMHVDAEGGADLSADATPLAAEEDADEFHTPKASPTLSLAPDDGFEAPDAMSVDHYRDEQAPSSGVVDADEVNDHLTSSPPGQNCADRSLANEDFDEDVRMSDPATPLTPEGCPICNTPLTSNERTATHHVEDCLSKNAIKGAENADSDNDLPDASTFMLPKTKSVPETLTPTRHNGSPRIQPIDLTLSSDAPGPAISPRPKKTKASLKKNPTLSGDPEAATAVEVDSWDFANLKTGMDRHRILIKCIREMVPQQREDLHQCLLRLGSQVKQAEQLCAAALTRETGAAEESGLGPDYAEMMLLCADLAAAWLVGNHKCFFETGHVEVPWEKLYNDEDDQLVMFLTKLLRLLKMKGSRLFTEPKVRHSGGKMGSSDIMIIPSDSDEVHQTPHKSRKNKIAESQSAKKSRSAALARHEQYTQRMESQTSDTSKLVAMLPSHPSNSEILINFAARNEGDDDIFIHPEIAKQIKPHQVEGVRFMWREITADGEDGRQGCLLAHTMGLGKTMQTITLLVAVVEASASPKLGVRRQLPKHLRPRRVRNGDRQLRILILCPPSLLPNWRAEIEQWAPTAIGNIFLVEATSSKNQQLQQIEGWYHIGGALLVGYEMFREFVSRKKTSFLTDEVGARLDEMLLKGPEIVVADEAHKLKDTGSKTSLAAGAIHTHTRIALTGTPMSNDVQEIYALVSWVAPGYLGEQREFRANVAEPIEQGTYMESTYYERRRSLKKLAFLHRDIEPKVNRADITVLRGSLKPKVEFVITVALTRIQKTVYKRYVEALLGGGRNEKAGQMTIFHWLAVLGLLTNHPSAFRRKLLPKPPPKKRKKTAPREVTPSEAESNGEVEAAAEPAAEADAGAGETAFGEQDVYALGFTEAMVHDILRDLEESHTSPTLSAKTSILLDIVQLSHECGDKLLVFSSSIPTLQYISEQLARCNIRFGRIDGSVPMPRRVQLLKDFHNDKFEVMVISTRAGGVGLNIQGANRVVIMDFGFNPAWEEQAIGRAYRLGQLKPVFVYRFLAGGTFETNLWNMQLFKTSLTNRVVDKKNTKRNAQRNTREYLHDPVETPQEDLSKWIGKDPMVLDRILSRPDEGDSGSIIRTILTTETLQEEVQDEPLNEEEKREVDEEILLGKARVRGRKANGYSAAKGGSTPVRPLAATQSASHARRPSGQATPISFIPAATAPAVGAGLPMHKSIQGHQRYGGPSS
ncbi:hypothetical protein LTR08_006095 [Meristemomyces frigidus]|nr:hypothetical protein LTR08_006095 [Meristemomyces frigidus]